MILAVRPISPLGLIFPASQGAVKPTSKRWPMPFRCWDQTAICVYLCSYDTLHFEKSFVIALFLKNGGLRAVQALCFIPNSFLQASRNHKAKAMSKERGNNTGHNTSRWESAGLPPGEPRACLATVCARSWVGARDREKRPLPRGRPGLGEGAMGRTGGICFKVPS